MKVTFTCEKCGHVFAELGVTHPDPTTLEARDVVSRQMKSATPCPNRSKLTYGPLTEEMVADALCEARWVGVGDGCQTIEDKEYDAMARFVLRLLRRLELEDGLKHINWLLDIARQS